MTARGLVRLMVLALLLALHVLLWALARPFGHGTGIVRSFLARGGRLLGLRVRVEGTPAPGDVLYVTNHISWLDIMAIGGATPTRFIAKAEIARWPLVGWLAKLAGSVFVHRDRRSQTRVQADTVVAALRESRPVTLFAEGGTHDGCVLAPFRPSLFVAAVDAGAHVQPVAIDYGPGRTRFAWPDGTSLATEMKRILNRAERIPVTLRFLPVLDAAALDRKALAARAHAAVDAALSR